MKKISKTIVFFGSGPVAAKSLELLHQNFEIEAVITKAAPAHHKGEVPVITLAEKLDLPVRLVSNKQDLDDLVGKEKFKSPVGVLIDFGIIVSQNVINSFPFGIVNSHFSLLPEWRGADPITFSILSGQKQTGVSLMLLSAGMDEGPILAYAPYQLDQKITTPQLTTALIELSDELLKSILPEYLSQKITAVPQDSTRATYSRKLTKADSIINWQDPADKIEREIRAFAEWPKSKTIINGLEIIIVKAKILSLTGKPGTATVQDNLPVIYCGVNALALETVKPAGKKEMSGEAFLAGYKQKFLN